MHGLGAQATLLGLTALLVAISSVAAYGHVINDIFDVEEDRRRGKANAMARLSRIQQLLVVLLFVALAFAPALLAGFGLFSIMLLVVNLLLPTIYSIPPINLKHRGFLGVAADALGAHVVPTLFFAVSMAHMAAAPGSRSGVFILAAGFWALATGLRGILLHQFVDRESDLSAGVKTFGGSVDGHRLRVAVMCVIFPCEVMALAVVIATVIPVAPLLIVIAPVYLILEALKMLAGWDLPLFYPDGTVKEPYVPIANNEFYEVWLPITLATQLALTVPSLLILPVLQVVLFFPNIRTRMRPLRDLWKSIRTQALRRMSTQSSGKALDRRG